MIAVLIAIAICSAIAAAPASAEVPSAQDQYLEVVPGPGGDQTPEQFSRSLGGDGGPITTAQVVALAKLKASQLERTGGRSDTSGSLRGDDGSTPGAVAAFTNAAADTPFDASFALILGVATLLTAGIGVAVRRGDAT